MNRLIPLLLILVLLTGCAAQNPGPIPGEGSSADLPVQTTAFLEVPEETGGVSWYSLPDNVTGFLPLGTRLLFFSGTGNAVLTLVDPVSRQILATRETDMALMPDNGTVQLLDWGFSCFRAQTGEVIVFDKDLQEISRITAPEAVTEIPLLSRDGKTLFYCTSSAIRALDADTGISRVLREISYPAQCLSGLLLEDTVLQVRVTEADGSRHTLFLSAENGQLLEKCAGTLHAETLKSRFFCRNDRILFGDAGENPMVLYPRESAENCFFPGGQILTAARRETELTLDLYDPNSGLRTSTLILPGTTTLRNAAAAHDGGIWLLIRQETGQLRLGLWNPTDTAVKDDAVYTAPRHTRQNPDQEGLAACSIYAQDMQSRHGVTVLISTDAAALQPQAYELEYEYDAAVIDRELKKLDTSLSHYPSGLLRTLSGRFSGINICIVRQIRGTPESGNTDTVDGIQFWNGYEAYIVLAAGQDTERRLYHEICHLMDTVVLTESTAYDQWDKLNPAKFQYAYSPVHAMNTDDWRQAGWESFVDSQAMCYPKDDRAKTMEYAMTAGNAELFQSPYLQAKLRLLCTGIREAFGLEEYPASFLWEQYLQGSLFP